MEVNTYNVIKNNIITNFLVPYYKFTIVRIKECVIADIKRRSWFPCKYDNSKDVLTFTLADDVNIDIKFIFEERKQDDNSTFYMLNDFE